MTEKKCGRCIYFIQFVGDGTGKCGAYSTEGEIGIDTPACDEYWNSADVCLVCKHWDPIKLDGKSTRWGQCDIDGMGYGAHRCGGHCSKFERREDYREYLQRLVEGRE